MIYVRLRRENLLMLYLAGKSKHNNEALIFMGALYLSLVLGCNERR